MNPLNTVKGAISVGLVLAIAVLVMIASQGTTIAHVQIDRWLHIVAGVTWIGLL